MSRQAAFLCTFLLVWLNLPFQPAAAHVPPEQFFESNIRPLLLDRCVSCHSDEHPEGGLSLESKLGWSDRGVIVLGDPQKSLLITAVRYQDAALRMPPEDSDVERLSENEIQDLEHWIRDGAVDPRESSVSDAGPKLRPRQFQITVQDLSHWSFRPILGVLEPQIAPSTPSVLDQLLDEKLAEFEILRSPTATPRELVRRAYFDLWGLPPSPEAVAAFEQDPSDEAWRELVDRLLDSINYGQRWGRHWLDWVRFAETNGYERDGLKPNAWRYRDYVISAFNSDKPYDRFLIEQLAGDLLIDAENLTFETTPQLWKDAVVATGYYRLHVWDDEPDNTDAAELDDLDDVIVTTGAAVLGMTLGCARCHDHKFDPLSQVDYYSLLDLLRDIDPYGASKKGGGGRGTGKIERFLCSDQALESWRLMQQQKVADLESQIANAAEPEANRLRDMIQGLRQEQPPFDQALAISPPTTGPKTTFLLSRGDHQSPLQPVKGGLPQLFNVLASSRESLALTDKIGPLHADSGKLESIKVRSRLELARWLTTSEHPLTARVLANRIWLNHFGAGIVPTPDDFGYTGIRPKHVELLDFLAAELIRGGWSIKQLHRLVMNSQTYRMSSNAYPERNPNALSQDPDNTLFWRQNLRRLDAESIRDSMLIYSNELNDKSSGPSVYSALSPEIRETANPVSLSNWEASPEQHQYCRSVFLVVKRSLKDPLLESFDFANSHTPVGQRPITTVAPQALMLLNDRFVEQRSQKIAKLLLQEYTEVRLRTERLWELVMQRKPSGSEQRAVDVFIQRRLSEKSTEQSAWSSVVRAVLNSNESIYVD